MLRHGANRFFQSLRVRLRFSSTQIIRFSFGSLFAILKNTVRFRLRFDKNSLKPVYKTPVWVRFDSLVLSSINTTHNDLDKLIENNAKGAAVRSRARWTEYGGKNTTYFLGLEKRNRDKKSTKSFKNTQGILITNQASILKELNSFYESLYSDNEQYNEDQCYDFIQSM